MSDFQIELTRLPKDRPNLIWLHQLYIGEGSSPLQVVVANVNDMVIDLENMRFYRVKYVVNDVPTIEFFDVVKGRPGNIENGLLDGLTNFNPDVTTRAFYNNRVDNKTIVLDSDYYLTGMEHAYCILYRGKLTPDTAPIAGVISRNLEGTSEKIMINAVSHDLGIRRPDLIYTDFNLVMGEELTLISYSHAGGITGIKYFTTVVSDAIRPPDVGVKSIVDIVLVSPLIDRVDNTLVKVKPNVPISAESFQAQLIYNDGTRSELMNIDGDKVGLLGLGGFNTSYEGPTRNVTVTYYLDDDEPAINMGTGEFKFIQRTYRVTTLVPDIDYSYKIYLTLEWNSLEQAYIPTWWLTNQRNETLINLTSDNVEVEAFIEGTQDPVNWGLLNEWQTINLALDINKAIGEVPSYIHTQTILVRLEAPVHEVENRPFMIAYDNDKVAAFGNWPLLRMNASTDGDKELDIQCNCTTKVEWLNELYYQTLPLFDRDVSELPEEPTHFKLIWKEDPFTPNTDYFMTEAISVDDWYKPIKRGDHSPAGNWLRNETVLIVWLYRLDSDEPGVWRYPAISPVTVETVIW